MSHSKEPSPSTQKPKMRIPSPVSSTFSSKPIPKTVDKDSDEFKQQCQKAFIAVQANERTEAVLKAAGNIKEYGQVKERLNEAEEALIKATMKVRSLEDSIRKARQINDLTQTTNLFKDPEFIKLLANLGEARISLEKIKADWEKIVSGIKQADQNTTSHIGGLDVTKEERKECEKSPSPVTISEAPNKNITESGSGSEYGTDELQQDTAEQANAMGDSGDPKTTFQDVITRARSGTHSPQGFREGDGLFPSQRTGSRER